VVPFYTYLKTVVDKMSTFFLMALKINISPFPPHSVNQFQIKYSSRYREA